MGTAAKKHQQEQVVAGEVREVARGGSDHQIEFGGRIKPSGLHSWHLIWFPFNSVFLRLDLGLEQVTPYLIDVESSSEKQEGW